MNRDRTAKEPPTLSFVGAGRAAAALALAARNAGYRIAAVYGRRRDRAVQVADLTGARLTPTALAAATSAEITIVAVPDGAIPGVAATLAATGARLAGRALVHTAARLGPEALAAARLSAAQVGVIHPLQALCGPESASLLDGSFFRVEAEGRLREQLDTLVAALGGHVLDVPPAARAVYHAAAVLAGNAPLALLARAEEVLQGAGVEPAAAHAALATLLHGAAANARRTHGAVALTGPVARGDVGAIAAHVDALQPDPDVRALYVTLAMEMARLAGRDAASLGRDAEQPVSAMQRVA